MMPANPAAIGTIDATSTVALKIRRSVEPRAETVIRGSSRTESQRKAVDAIAKPGRSGPVVEDMAKMTAAPGA